MARRILLIGYGNPAREDDGLGPAAAMALENLSIDGLTVDADYQLTVTDAATVAEFDVVIFVDAAVEGIEPFSFGRLAPRSQSSFSSHSISPEAVLALAEELFGAKKEAYMLAIKGYSFAMFKEKMTLEASANLAKAVQFLAATIESGNFCEER